MPDSQQTLKERFYAGRPVRYVPYHANGDSSHPDCQNGVVSSVRNTNIFVRFTSGGTAEACKEDQLK